MLKEQIEKIKSLVVKKEEGNNKKNIENLVIFLIILIITIIAINMIWKDDKNASNNIEENNATRQLANRDISFNDDNTRR